MHSRPKSTHDIGTLSNSEIPAGKGKPPVGDVFQFPELGLSFTPSHGSMIAFESSKLLQGTRDPVEGGQGCERIGLAVCQHNFAVKVA